MITSANNPKIIHLTEVRKSRSYREEHQSVLVIGEKFIRETLAYASLKMVISTSDPHLSIDKEKVFIVTSALLSKITGLALEEGMAAEFVLPNATPFTSAQKLVALDRISDPGNLGALIRSQLAFGWNQLFLLPGCSDLFNDKAIRASASTVFRIEWQRGSWQELKNFVKKNEMKAYVADTKGKNVAEVKAIKPCLLISNEATGLSEEAQNWGEKITLPMANNIESLNAAVAGGLLLYLLQ